MNSSLGTHASKTSLDVLNDTNGIVLGSHNGTNNGEEDGHHIGNVGDDKPAPAHVEIARAKWSAQYKALLRKHWIQSKRHRKQSFAQLFSPVLVTILLIVMQQISNYVLNHDDPNPPKNKIHPLQRCVPGENQPAVQFQRNGNLDSAKCQTIVYAPASDMLHSFMGKVAERNKLSFEDDFLSLPGATDLRDADNWQWANSSTTTQEECVPCDNDPTTEDIQAMLQFQSLIDDDENDDPYGPSFWSTSYCLPCGFIRDNNTLTDWILNHPNFTQNFVLFPLPYISCSFEQNPMGICEQVLNSSLSSRSYIIYYNYTIGQYPFFENDHAMEVKRAIEKAHLAECVESEEGFELDINWRKFPSPKPRLQGYDVVAANGGVWFYLPPMIIFFVVLTEVVDEKESKLRIGMKQMGLRDSVFWAAWFTHGIAMCFLSTLLLCLSGWVAHFSIFVNSTFIIPFALFFIFGVAMVSIACFLSTYITRARTAQTAGYSIILMGFVFQAIMSSGYGALVDFLYESNIADWIKFVRAVLTMYPPFNMAKMFYDLSAKAGSDVDFRAGMVVKGDGFHIHDLTESREAFVFGYHINIPPPEYALLFLLMNAVVFFILTGYQDAVISGDQGPGKHPLFFLKPLLRMCMPDGLTSARRQNGSWAFFLTNFVAIESIPECELITPMEDIDDEGVHEEAIFAKDQSLQDENVLVRIRDLVKVYHRQSSLLTLPFRFIKGLLRFLIVRTQTLSFNRIVYAISCCNARSSKVRSLYMATEETSVNTIVSVNDADRQSLLQSTEKGNLCCRRFYRQKSVVPDTSLPGGAEKDANVVSAVNGVSFTVRKNEIFCLLGHNGAGKTTTLSILTGLFKATSGTVDVMGYDVGTGAEVRSAQKCMGVCPQHDILWGELSAAEHLRTFAAIKGIQGGHEAREREIQRVLEFVDLWHVRDQVVSGFSGGMKRRLSLAISAIGDPQVLYLDEPTTGMDPVNRRQAWRLIQSLKTNRAVILTTHDMVEAETLSDRVGIMAHGKLFALGTTLHLKNKYGSGYRLNITLPQPESNSEVVQFRETILDEIMQHMHKTLNMNLTTSSSLVRSNNIRIVNQDAGAITIGIPSEDKYMPYFLELIRELEERAGTSALSSMQEVEAFDDSPLRLIREWGIAHTSLEDVFITVSRVAKFDLAAEREDDSADEVESARTVHKSLSGESVESSGAKIDAQKPRSYSFRALIRKNLTLQLRQRGLCLCQIIAPLTVIGLLVLLQYIIKSEIGSSHRTLVPALVVPLNLQQLQNAMPSNGLGGNLIETLLQQSYQSYGEGEFHNVGMRELAPGPGPGGGSASNIPANESDCLLFFYYTVDPDRGTNLTELWKRTGFLSKRGESSGLLGNIMQANCTLKNDSAVKVPYFVKREDSEEAYESLYSILESFNDISIHDIQNRPPCEPKEDCPAYELPDGFVNMHEIEYSNRPRLAYTFSVNDAQYFPYHRPNNFTRLGIPNPPAWIQEQSVTITPARLGLMNYISKSFEQDACNLPSIPGGIAGFLEDLLEFRAVATMPVEEWNNPMQIVEVFGSFLYPIALTLQLPLYIYIMVLEKETRLIELQKIMGMKWSPYVITTYVLNLCIYATVVAAFWITGSVMNFAFFVGTNRGALFLLFLGWGLALVSFGFFLASFMSSRRVASVVGYVVALFGNLVALVLSDGIYGNIPPFSIAHRLPSWLYVFPMFGFVRPIYLMNFACVFRRHCLGTFSEAMAEDGEITVGIVSLYACAVGYMILGLYLDEVLPKQYGVPKRPLFCCPRVVKGTSSRFTSYLSSQMFSLSQCMRSIVAQGRSYSRLGNDPTTVPQMDTIPGHLEMITNSGGRLASSGKVKFSDSHSGATSGESQYLLRDLIHGDALTDVKENDRVAARELLSDLGVVDHSQQDLDALAFAIREDVGVIDERVRVNSLVKNGVDEEGHNSSSETEPVLIHRIRKVYEGDNTMKRLMGESSGKVAVSNMDIAIRRVECFGLLGENGAGKTTLISMISGVFPPTNGNSWVGKYNVQNETDLTHLLTGLCPQHGILWEDLTVEEHLLFFSRLKGVPPKAENIHVERSLHSVGLTGARKRYAKNLSGGMQRRLSIALTLVGTSEVVLLDEPTTGLDPASRRRVWSVISDAKQSGDKALILTTHSMDEADLLSSRIAIVTHGRMRVLGSQQTLKNNYGGGYRLDVSFPCTSEMQSNVISWIQQKFPEAKKDMVFNGFVSFLFSSSNNTKVADIFSIMHSEAKTAIGITDWAVSQVSLEDVFQRVVRAHNTSTS